MTLKEFKDYINGFPNGTEFDFGVSEPFSWRGSYDEVAFDIMEQKMSKENILKNIELAYTETHFGYKGGEYQYKDYTDIHFEESCGRYTDGGYCANWIAKIEQSVPYQSQEERLVKLAFN